jgi:peptide/nickel transport system substrate-binding protein
MKHTIRAILVASVALLAIGGTAQAQKSKDTLRVAVDQPIRVIDRIYNPNPEANLVDRAVMSRLIDFDPATKSYKGDVAESWKRVDDKTLEFKLRQGIKFHDGSELDADDVVYSLQFAVDPKNNFLFKEARFGWIDHAEKVDKYTVRVIAKETTAIDLARLWGDPPILPSDAHSKLAEKSEFGRAPIGSGPYKVVQYTTDKIVLEKNPYYNWGSYDPEGKVKRIEIVTIPDEQTRLAKLMVGELDLIFHLDYDQAKNAVASNPDIRLLTAPTTSFSYILFDTADRSGIHVFKDKRVREALLRAIDVQAMRKAFLSPEFAAKPPMQAMCYQGLYACAWSTKPVSYDPAKAKALLAEAGLKDGFDLQLLTWGQTRPVAEAVAGDLRKIGVRASVQAATINAFQKARGDGKSQTMVTNWDNAGGAPDVDNTATFFYQPSPRNYIHDEQLAKWTDEAEHILDLKKREDIYRKLFDRVNEESYAMPLVEQPAVVLHSKDVVIDTNHTKPEGFLFNRVGWAK